MPADKTAGDLECEGENARLAVSRLQRRLDPVQKLRLKTVIKVTVAVSVTRQEQCLQNLDKLPLKPQEAHGAPIQQLCFNHVASAMANLFATVGSNQVMIWKYRQLNPPEVHVLLAGHHL